MLAVLSDIHDNLVNLDKVITWAKANQAMAFLVLGDLTNFDTLDYLGQQWQETIYIVQGNMELYQIEDLKKYPQYINLGRRGGVVNIAKHDIGLCHEPQLLTGLVPSKPEIVFYGHTHIPWEEIRQGVHFVNPGNVAGVRNEASFASYEPEDQSLKLYRLNDLP